MQRLIFESSTEGTTPKVSVVVVAYNFGATVLESLESIKKQTYRDIEIVVTDDFSSDDTIDICVKWLKFNCGRFVNAKLVSSSVNTGVAANLNRGIRASNGRWIKTLAGDDALEENAIEEFLNYMEKDSTRKMCVSNVCLFTSDEGCVSSNEIEAYDHFLELEKEPYEQQFQRVLRQLIFVGPGYFFSRALFEEVGGFDEKYALCEEWPFVYKVLKSGKRIYVIDEKLVRYRVSSMSLSRKRKGGRYKLFKDAFDFYKDVLFKELLPISMIDAFKYYAYYFLVYEYHKLKSKGII